MKIRTGFTRFVIVGHWYAYKIAKLNMVYISKTGFLYLFRKSKRVKVNQELSVRSSFLIKEVVRVLLLGFSSNLREYHYWMETKDRRVPACHMVFLWGLVLIQERLEPVTEEELKRDHPIREYARKDFDLDRVVQYGVAADGRVVVADFGNVSTQQALRMSAKAGRCDD